MGIGSNDKVIISDFKCVIFINRDVCVVMLYMNCNCCKKEMYM